ncbi:MAG: DinB family protein [Chloroflexi bacterium]|nr:DinB family protein [Chloroflexota bacterium]
MSDTLLRAHFVEAMLMSLDETFDNVQGIYLDRNTSLFGTLATITAEEASRPVSTNCASLAAHVEHMRFYMDVTLRWVAGDHSRPDWGEIWRTVREVTPEQWADSQRRLRESYNQIRELVQVTPWEDANEIGGAMGILMHNAYHLGEIRQALCTLKPDR